VPNFTPIGATCRPCGAKNLKIGICVHEIPVACAARNAAGNDDDNNNNFFRTAARRWISVTFEKMTTKFKILFSSLRSFAVLCDI